MSVCIKDQIQNMNLVIGCTIGCPYCYARNNTRRYHMIDDFEKPEFFPGKLKIDVRDWNGKHDRMSRGITLTEDQAMKMTKALSERFSARSAQEHATPMKNDMVR